MPQQVLNSVENNFTKGLLTEFTGLNFPENAATATSNCIYTLIGDVTRREGFDYEANSQPNIVGRTNQAISTYKWNNASGDGQTQFVVQQVGNIIYFYKSSAATVASPLSAQRLLDTLDISTSVPMGGTFDPTVECQYTDGNGYLFIYHPTCDPTYCIYNPLTNIITPNVIPLQIRDFVGVLEPGVGLTVRPNTLSLEHNYNISNQGWTSANAWSSTSTTALTPALGAFSITVGTGLSISNGDIFNMSATDGLYNTPSFNSFNILTVTATMVGTVTSYTSGTGALSINITSFGLSSNAWPFPNYGGVGNTFYVSGSYYAVNFPWTISSVNKGLVNTWHTAEGNYPSNADVWWYFKDSTGIFSPAATQPSVTLATGRAPQGHYLLPAFNLDRNTASGLSGITTASTLSRPSTGTWFQGRVWYTGVNSTFNTAGDIANVSWTENIYFSQIITSPTQFGYCYQTNDPTSETLFDILPTDGGVIQIQGSGGIYKLFPLLNAMLIFAANGVWYLSGSTGIGFTATDYSLVKLSAVRSISSYSFVDINGLPMFWNEEGIYKVEPAKQGTSLLNSPLHVNPLEVNPITVGTIQTFYDNIPLKSKQYARGVYDPINYIVQMVYKTVNETSITDRYTYDGILVYNTHNQAFYPYQFDIVTGSPPTINGIIYVQSPGGLNTPDSIIKYLVSTSSAFTFAEENNPNLVDWQTAGVSNSYVSNFTTGFKLHGQASRKFQIPYVYIYSRLNGQPNSYSINSQWDYPLNTTSGKISNAQYVTINSPNFGMAYRRHRLRGRGIALQLNVTSIADEPFDIMGWALYETTNQGP
jgi:hypothetical protein